MAPYARNGDDICVSLHSGVHGPKYIFHIKAVYILVYQKYMLQLTESREGQKSRLPLSPFIRRGGLLKLQHCHVFPSARRSTVHIQQSSRHGLFHHPVNTGLCGNSRHGDVLLAGADASLHDRVFSVSHCLYLDQPALAAGRTCIAWKLRHGIARMAVLVFLDPHSRDHFSFYDILSIGNAVFFYGKTGSQLHWFSSQSPCNSQLVIS